MLLNKKQLFFRDLFRSRKMLSWLKKICWILFFLLCMIKLYAQSEVIPGLFTTYQQNGRILWVIPDSLLGRDMSLTTTILEGAGRKKKSADAKFGYQGDRFGPRILRWEEEKERIILKEIRSYVDTSGSYSLGSLLSEREMPLTLQEFEILGCEKTGKIIDVTEWLRDGKLWGLQPFSFLIGIGSEREGRVTAIFGTPESVIVRSERIYEAVERTPATSANGEVTRWKLGCCLRLLPRHLMQVRYASSGVGYFTVPYAHMEPGSCQVISDRVVKRWRLEVADRDTARYRRGELVEPRQKIRIYIDRSFPEKWRPYVLRAVNNWNALFERSGFKNAIAGLMAPDSAGFTLDNSALSWIVYKASPMENAYGRPFVDFRTGEILSCHIAVFHSVFDMLCQWYIAQTGESEEEFPDELAGRLLEMVVSHEVGHVLGLTHNFYGSSLCETEQLRDAVFLHRHGYGSSIMDYMRMNYAVQPEDGVDMSDRIPRIGAYDSLAIEWGYRYFPGLASEEIQEKLSVWIEKKQLERKYRFQDSGGNLPEAQAEDLGCYSLETAELGMCHLKRLLRDTLRNNGRLSVESWNLAIRKQYSEYINQAFTYLGGIRKCWGNDSVIVVAVGREEQQDALRFLQTYVLESGKDLPREWWEDWGRETVRRLVEKADYFVGYDREYSVTEYIRDLGKIFRNVSGEECWGRFLIWCYTDCLMEYIQTERNRYPEVVALMEEQLKVMYRKTDKEKDVFWKAWRKNVNSIWK